MAIQAKPRYVLVFRRDEVGDAGVVGVLAGKAGDRKGVIAQVDVGARNGMPPDGVGKLVSSVEVQVGQGFHLLERDCGAPRERGSVGLAVHLHEATDMAGRTDILERGVEMGPEIIGVW